MLTERIRAIVIWSVAMLCVASLAGCNQKPAAPPANNQQVESLKAILTGVEQQSEQLDRIEAAVTKPAPPVCNNPACKCINCTCGDCKCGEIVEPPTEPELPAGLKAGQEILSRYTGVPWLFNGGRTSKAVLISHIVDHGLPRDGLGQFSFDDLQRIHGALHSDEATRLMYPTKPRTVSRPIKRVQQRAIRRAPVRVQNCPGGYCPRR